MEPVQQAKAQNCSAILTLGGRVSQGATIAVLVARHVRARHMRGPDGEKGRRLGPA